MPRPKRINPMLKLARGYLARHAPELQHAPLRLRMLDGPPGSPRYAATAEACIAARCPHGVTPEAAAAGQCHVLTCPLRHSVRLLLDSGGNLLSVTRSGIHWS
jgi:hypothetical protein